MAWELGTRCRVGQLLMGRGTGGPVARTVVSCSVVSEAQSCLTLCHPMDYSLPVSSVQGIFQARILKRVAISLSRGSS